MNDLPLGWRALHWEAIHLTTLTGRCLVNQSINCSFASVINENMKSGGKRRGKGRSESGLFVRWNGTKVLPEYADGGWFRLSHSPCLHFHHAT